MKNAKAYAVAVLDLCKENNKDINKVVSDLQLISDSFDDEIIKFFKTPKVSISEKKEVITKVFKDLDKDIYGLLMVLVDNNAILSLDDIIEEIKSLIAEEEGYVTVEVTSVHELTIDEIDSIMTYFEKKLNKKVKLQETIDKKLVGGLIIKYNGKIIDGSLFTKSESLKEYLKK